MLKIFAIAAAASVIGAFALSPSHVPNHSDFRTMESRTMGFAACDWLRVHKDRADYRRVAIDTHATIGDVIVYCAVTDSGRGL